MKKPMFILISLLTLPATVPAQTPSPGHASFVPNANSSWDHYFNAPSSSLQQFMLGHFPNMLVYSPFFNSQTYWYPNAYLYVDLYGIQIGSEETVFHPEWILKDQKGNWLYIPF